MSRKRAQEWLCRELGLNFPYVKMGNIDSLHLFGDTELMLFAIYEHNVGRWINVADIGANLGLHSIILDRMGMKVHAYEPDPEHFGRLLTNLDNNKANAVDTIQAAVSTQVGKAKFVRVLNNLTGNHLEGYKQSYGPRETITVNTVDCRPIFEWAHFAKLDCEGNEAELCDTLTAKHMETLQLVMEVRNLENAASIFQHFQEIGVPIWAQKIDWEKVRSIDDMPKSNREGSVFVGHKGPFA